MKNAYYHHLTAVLKNKISLTKEEIKKCCQELNIDKYQFMYACLDVIKERAVPPISHFHVGAIVEGQSGNIYFGSNQEFFYTLSQCIHAEQAAAYMAYLAGEEKINTLVVNAAPCGFCRQFLYEIANVEDMLILFPDSPPCRLIDLLPHAFGPADLGAQGGLLHFYGNSTLKLEHSNHDELAHAALTAARRSYSPYWHIYSGVALSAHDDAIFYGSYLENVAVNPALTPMQTALIHLVQAGYSYDTIKRAVLVEPQNIPVSQAAISQALLASINVEAEFQVVNLVS